MNSAQGLYHSGSGDSTCPGAEVQHPNKSTQTGSVKQSCCKRCKRKIAGFFFRRIKKCVKENMFGTYNPAVEHYGIDGKDIGSLKSKLDVNKMSVMTLFKKHLRTSKLTLKNVDLIEGLSAKDLKKKFSIKGSKGEVLEKMVDDYQRGKLSSSRLPDKSKSDARKLNKEQMQAILQDYQMMRNRIKDNRNLDADDLKKKFSVSGSRGKILEKMVIDFKNGKASATGLSVKGKFDPEKLNKDKLNEMINKYEAAQKAQKRFSFQSKNKFQKLFDNVTSAPISLPSWLKR